MSYLDRFMEYAGAFEETFIDDNWQRLEQHFTEYATFSGNAIQTMTDWMQAHSEALG